MSDGFREQALREMGLAPLWLRRGVEGSHAVGALPPGVTPTTFVKSEVRGEVNNVTQNEVQTEAQSGAPVDLIDPPQMSPASDRPAAIARMPWAELADTVAQCSACPLGLTRRQAVFGAGVSDAPWLLVGEAPGEDEDASGMPFVGASGHLLDNMLRAAGVSREHETYITNTVKCRPPASRRPEPGEVHQCAPHLERQIALLRPRLILALGAVAAQSLLATDAPVGSLRGRVHVGRFGDREIPVIVTFHPAYVLRKLSEKASAWADLCLATETMRNLVNASA